MGFGCAGGAPSCGLVQGLPSTGAFCWTPCCACCCADGVQQHAAFFRSCRTAGLTNSSSVQKDWIDPCLLQHSKFAHGPVSRRVYLHMVLQATMTQPKLLSVALLYRVVSCRPSMSLAPSMLRSCPSSSGPWPSCSTLLPPSGWPTCCVRALRWLVVCRHSHWCCCWGHSHAGTCQRCILLDTTGVGRVQSPSSNVGSFPHS